MVAYSFKRRFVAPILAGEKDGTIREVRRRPHAAPGHALQLYTGMRTRHCELILRTVCVAVQQIVLRWRPWVGVEVDGRPLTAEEMDVLARRDGFASFDGMREFWVEVHPDIDVFPGRWIRWRPPSQTVATGTTVATAAADRRAVEG